MTNDKRLNRCKVTSRIAVALTARRGWRCQVLISLFFFPFLLALSLSLSPNSFSQSDLEWLYSAKTVLWCLWPNESLFLSHPSLSRSQIGHAASNDLYFISLLASLLKHHQQNMQLWQYSLSFSPLLALVPSHRTQMWLPLQMWSL